MILVTGCNETYQRRMNGYLDTLEAHADFPVYFVGVGFLPTRSSERITAVSISREENEGAPPETESIQHGSFLAAVPGKASEVIIYTDGDFMMQRQMDDGERAFLDLTDDQVVTGYNFSPQCTLAEDAKIIGPYRYEALRKEWGELIYTAQDWNAGFLAMNRRTWERLYRAYMADWERACLTFRHQARQQWLISYEIAALGLDVKICPWSLHAHGHGGMKPGMGHGPGGIWADGKLALFRHYL